MTKVYISRTQSSVFNGYQVVYEQYVLKLFEDEDAANGKDVSMARAAIKAAELQPLFDKLQETKGTDQMIGVLCRIIKGANSSNLPQGTVKALQRRGILDNNCQPIRQDKAVQP